jgi:AcrR family transcriptional regulator
MTIHQAKRKPGRRPIEEGDAEATRRTILDHAWRLFNMQSYSSLSMDDIARAAGVTKATLYYHFPGKGDLLVAGAQTHLVQSLEAAQRIAAQRTVPTSERLRMLLDSWIDNLPENYNEAMWVEAIVHLQPAQQKALFPLLDALVEPLTSIMSEGVANGELRPLDAKLLALSFRQLASTSELAPSQGREPARQLSYQLLDIFLFGVMATPAPTPDKGKEEKSPKK